MSSTIQLDTSEMTAAVESTSPAAAALDLALPIPLVTSESQDLRATITEKANQLLEKSLARERELESSSLAMPTFSVTTFPSVREQNIAALRASAHSLIQSVKAPISPNGVTIVQSTTRAKSAPNTPRQSATQASPRSQLSPSASAYAAMLVEQSKRRRSMSANKLSTTTASTTATSPKSPRSPRSVSLATSKSPRSTSAASSTVTSTVSTPRESLGNNSNTSGNNSSSSSADMLRGVFETGLAALVGSRTRLEHEMQHQKQDELAFTESMKQLMKQIVLEKNAWKERESALVQKAQDLQRQLDRETEEKRRAQRQFESFKSEGSAIILRLRESLSSLSEKYKEERAKNAALLRMMEQGIALGGDNVRVPSQTAATTTDVGQLEQTCDSLRIALGKAKQEIVSLRQSKASGATAVPTESTTNTSSELSQLKSQLNTERELRKQTEAVMESRFDRFKRLLIDEAQLIEGLKSKVAQLEVEKASLQLLHTQADTQESLAQRQPEMSAPPMEPASIVDEESMGEQQQESDALEQDVHIKVDYQDEVELTSPVANQAEEESLPEAEAKRDEEQLELNA